MDDDPFYYTAFSPPSVPPDPDSHLFLYVGELKGLGLDAYLAPAISRQAGRPARCLAIVPDILSRYPDGELISFSPLHDHHVRDHGSAVSYRTPGRIFAAAVSAHPEIRALVSRIVARQGNCELFMFESLPEMSLDEIPGVRLVGPDKHLAHRLNHKGIQLELLAGQVPLAEFRRCRDLDQALRDVGELIDCWSEGIFVSRPYSAAGANSGLFFSVREIEKRFSDDPAGELLLSRYLPHDHDPTVLAVAGKDQVYIAGIADQRIEHGNRFVGSSWPTVLPPEIKRELYLHTRKVGEILSDQGYRGIFGCDFIVTREGAVRFIEINSRKQGTTLEFCHSLARILPPATPSLMELEYLAVHDQPFPGTAVEPSPELEPGFCWATRNIKTGRLVRTCATLAHDAGEGDLFARVADGSLDGGAVLLEHVGPDRVVLPGTFLARTVAVGRDHATVARELEKAVRKIHATII